MTDDNNKEKILTVSEALRLMLEDGDHTKIIKVGGVISSVRPVFRMIAGESGQCPYCHTMYHHTYEKPLFDYPLTPHLRFCTNENAFEHPVDFIMADKEKGRFVDEEGNHFDILKDDEGKIVKKRVYLKVSYEYRNALVIELQDADKYEDTESLEVILFDNNTEGVQAGELVTIRGQAYTEKLTSSKDARFRSRLYSHTINYETRKEISISNVDKDAMHRFALFGPNKFAKTTIDKLVKMFAPQVLGYEFVKKGLLLCAASCANDFQNNLTDASKQRVRMHSLLIGDPGTAKSILTREITKIVPNSRYQSMSMQIGLGERNTWKLHIFWKRNTSS